MKNWKQIVAALGAAVLVATSVGTVPQVAYAEETTENEEFEVEEEETEEPEEEVKKEETEEPEEEVKEEETEEPEEEVEEEEIEEPEEETEISLASNDIVIGSVNDFRWEDNGTTISLENNLPDGGKIAVETKNDVTVTDRTVLAAYDISILVDNVETQPTDAVTVTITDAMLSGKSRVNVYHFADGSTNADLVEENAIVKDNTVSFKASSFSVYALTDGTELDIAKVELKDTEDGYLTATIMNSQGQDITKAVNAAEENGELTYVWSKTDDNDADAGSVSSSALDSNRVNVSVDNGSQLTYKLTVKSATDTEDEGTTSNGVKVTYYSELKNGGFEEPILDSTRRVDGSDYNHIDLKTSGYAYVKVQNTDLIWNTTASDKELELGQYNHSGDAHQAYKDTFDDSVGYQYSELNAQAAGALYQDVLTYGDADLSWSLLHRASNTADGTDKMYVVLMSTEDAEKALSAFKGNEQNSLKAMMEAVLTADNGGAGVTTSYNLDTKAVGGGKNSVGVTVWKIATHTQKTDTVDGVKKYKSEKGNITDGSANGIEGEYSDDTGWARYTGSYTVPEGQYLTRFFFLSAETDANRGNLLDEVSFQQEVKNNASGKIKWVGDDATTRPDPKDVKITTKVGGKEYTAKVTVKNGNWTYEFEDLPKNDMDGKPIEYTITTTVDGYTADIDKDGKVTYTKTRKVTGKLVWDDGNNADGVRPKTVTLTFKGSDGKTYERTVKVTADGSYTYDINDLPQYDAAGNPIKYELGNIKIDGYEVEITGNEEDGFTINCKHEVKRTSDSGSGDSGDKHDGGGYAKVDFYLVDNATTKSLTGGVYGLYTSAGELVGTYTTDANGHIQFPNLKGGTYYLQELTSPDGYALNGNKIYFTVDGTPIAVMDTNQALTAAGATAAADADAAAAAGVTGTDAAQNAASGDGTGIGVENGAAVGATGDDSLMTVYAATAAMAAAVLAAWFAMTRKHANR